MAQPDNKSKTLTKIRFVYEKARHHRTFRADGAWVGLSPSGEVQFAFFNDLRPMPKWISHDVAPDGSLGAEVSREHNPGDIVREANVTVLMDKEKTKQFIALLAQMVAQLEKNEAAETEKGDSQTDALKVETG
jgi:hypothetical protein